LYSSYNSMMKNTYTFSTCRTILLLALLYLSNTLSAQVSFEHTPLKNADGTPLSINNPTSLQFGPDGRLYVAEQGGAIYAYTVTRAGKGDFKITATETITLVRDIPNHDDDGKLNTTVKTRQVTGILVAGTAANPMLYVGSSDPRIGGGGGAADKNLDTNSGIISLLTKSGSGWQKVDLVRGLPRSEENHANNGMQLDEEKNILYVAQGGSTNAGAPSNNFAFITEYALAAAILSVDLNVINALPTQTDANGQKYKYDLPTVDDPTRSNQDGADPGDPFGGNDGLNQAKLVAGGPVQVYSSGYRNAYDLVITKTPGREGKMYTIDNGANGGWGGHPDNEGNDGKVTNNYVEGEPGSTVPGPNDDKVNNKDGLHLVKKGFYAGHPNPIRANPEGAGLYTYGTQGVWRTSKTDPNNPLPADWPPVPPSMANPIEGDYRNPGVNDGSMYLWNTSVNGIAEYTSTNFNSAILGNLLATTWDGNIYRIELNATGDKVNSAQVLASGFMNPLDVIAQGDDEVFPGTIWSAIYGGKSIAIFEPVDYTNCEGKDDPNLDDDGDGYSNADEIDNGTNPCSPASKPSDHDGDLLSDLNDTDDDNDKLPDTEDYFALDASNGTKTTLPISYPLLNNDPGTGFFGLGFTGLMSNGKTDYLKAYNEDLLIAGGAVGAFTVDGVTAGDAYMATNSQEHAFQFGINANSNTGPFTVNGKLLSPFFNNQAPVNYQSQGIYIGTGDQDNYLKIVLLADGGGGGLQVLYESDGVIKSDAAYSVYRTGTQYIPDNVLAATTIDFYLSVDPTLGSVQPKYQINSGEIKNLGLPVFLEGKLLTAVKSDPAVAVGVIASSTGSNQPFTATWDHIAVTLEPVQTAGTWKTVTSTGNPEARHENSFVQVGDKFYLLGGRGIKNVNIYNTKTNTWSAGAKPPVEIHHFQALNYHGLIYVVSAFTGKYPGETPLKNIYIYNPVTDQWITGPEIPAARRRGSAGASIYKDKIYLVAGLTNGHTSGHVKWFDEYDPATNTWKVLPDAPRARDHFHAAVVNDKAYAIAGRLSKSATGVFANTIAEVDVYDFKSGSWSTLPTPQGNLPTPRAAAAIAVLGNEILAIGGESNTQSAAHNETEALNTTTNTWRRLTPLNQGRHGTQAIVSNGGVYVAAGNKTQGGGNELNSMEVFHMFNETQPSGTPVTAGTLDSPAALALGNVNTDQTVTKKLSLKNTGGNQGILITALTISGSTEFTVNSPYPLPLLIKPGQSIDVEVSLASATAGSKSASLEIQHTGAAGKATVKLTGNVEKTASLASSTESLHFLSQEAGTVSPTQDVTVKNNGKEAVIINKVGITGANAAEFKHSFSSAVTINPGSSHIINVSFAPQSQGLKHGTLKVTSEDSGEELTVKLSGEGIDSVVTASPTLTQVESGYKLYPNPVENLLFIEFHGAGNKLESIEIFDLLGKKYLGSAPEIKNNMMEVDLSSLNMNSGVYFIRVKTAQYQKMTKFIKR
jgi:N-acetylneuraminic acid mutarotase